MVQLTSDAPAPRLCTLQKSAPTQEYGYNLHAEKGRGQFVGMVDKGSVADLGGLRTGDRIFAINGHSIVGETHKKVVERIKERPTSCEMLVLTEEEAKWYAEHEIPINLNLPNIIRLPGEASSHRGSNANNSPPPATWYAPSSKPADPVFVAPPPPHDDMDHHLPVICTLEKSSPGEEFGFNLHAEKNRGHFIGTVDVGGIGDRAGLKTGQRIVGVNGTLVFPQTAHKEVVSLIKKSPLSTTLLLASEEVDQWHKQHNEPFSFDKARQAVHPEQQLSPHSIQISDEEEVIEAVHPSPAPRHEETHVEVAPPLPAVRYEEPPPMAQYDLVPPDQDDDLMAAVFGDSAVIAIGVREEEEKEQQHLLEHDGHHGQPLVAEEEEEEEHLPAYNAYSEVQPMQYHEEHHHEDFSHHSSHPHHHHHHHEEHDHNHNGHHDPYHNGKHSGGYSSQTSESSEVDIFRLSAKEARERLRHQKKRAHDMSLEEKYRVVSSM